MVLGSRTTLWPVVAGSVSWAARFHNASNPIPFISLLTSIRLPLSLDSKVASSSPCSLKMSATFSIAEAREPAGSDDQDSNASAAASTATSTSAASLLGIWVQTSPGGRLDRVQHGAGLSGAKLPPDQVAKRLDVAHHAPPPGELRAEMTRILSVSGPAGRGGREIGGYDLHAQLEGPRRPKRKLGSSNPTVYCHVRASLGATHWEGLWTATGRTGPT